MMKHVIRWIAGTMPRSWRIAVLREFAWPEFTVTREWLVPDAEAACGFRVTQMPLDEVRGAEAIARAMLETPVSIHLGQGAVENWTVR